MEHNVAEAWIGIACGKRHREVGAVYFIHSTDFVNSISSGLPFLLLCDTLPMLLIQIVSLSDSLPKIVSCRSLMFSDRRC